MFLIDLYIANWKYLPTYMTFISAIYVDIQRHARFIELSIKLHSFVHYSPRDVHRIVDKFNNAL